MSSPPLTNREYAYFSVVGPGDHRVITEKVGFSPSEAWSAGDINPRNGKPRQFMFWQLNSGLDDTSSLDQHIESLLLTLGTKAQALRDLWVDYDLTIQCVGYYPGSGHGAHINREVVRRAAQLGLAFDLDFYYVADPEADG
jgi:hypothetical protein